MKVYLTVIPDEEDLIGFDTIIDPKRETDPGEKLGAILTFTGIMIKENIPIRLVITNMKRNRTPEFVRASEL